MNEEEIMDYCEKCTENKSLKMENIKSYRQTVNRRGRRKMHSRLLLVLLSMITLIPTLALANNICQHHEYWDPQNDECVPCTKCNRHQIVVRPCQKHLDTVCKHLNSIEIDWSKSMATERPEIRRTHPHHHIMTLSSDHDHLNYQPEAAASREEQEILFWDWQLIFLILAIISCLLFFLVTAFIFINYVRQWRKIKKQFDTDIEHLSQQLMVKLAVPPVESSTIFIDDPSTRHSILGPRQIEVRCVYLEDIIAGKESIKEPRSIDRVKKITTGNMYIYVHLLLGDTKKPLIKK